MKKLLSKIKNLFWPTEENQHQPILLTDRAISSMILLFLLVKVVFSFEILILRQSSLFADVSAQRILELTNDLRKQYGLPPLNENPLLKQAAQEKALDMIKNKYFAHFSPSGISPWYFIEKNGYDYHYAGENLAMNFIDSEEVVKAWVNSPTHRQNLLNQNYKEIGIAVLSGDITGDNLSKIVVVQMFGSPMAKPKSLTKVAQAQENINASPPTTLLTPITSKTPTTLKSTTTTVLQTTTTALKPSEKEIAKVEGTNLEEKPLTSFNNETSTNNETTTVVSPVLEENQASQENAFKEISEEKPIREKINYFNQIVALLLISLGAIVLIGIIINQRKETASLVLSELVVRGALVILIGFAFLLFKMEIFIGHLAIA